MRSAADWLVGMNVSRAYSICAGTNVPIGRVLTATLALIVARDKEVESYKELYTYGISARWGNIDFTFFNQQGTKFEQETYCRKIISDIKENIFGLDLFKEQALTENPPSTFNLPELQKEANRVFGFALDETLRIAQRLYEKKLITYPRTDSRYLPTSGRDKYYQILDKLALNKEKKYIRQDRENVPSIKDTDSAHTALIPTGDLAKNLIGKEADLYELVRERFVTAFMIPRKYKQYNLTIKDKDGHTLKARLVFDLEKGFKTLGRNHNSDEDKAQDTAVQILSQAPLEESLKKIKEPLTDIDLIKNKKSKPKYYTAATLITAMQNCGKLLDNEQSRQVLKEVKGIGTPATQAVFPVNLQRYGYIKTLKKYFISTPKGRSLIASIKPELASPELTADWEYKLKEIERGRFISETFNTQIREFVKEIIKDVRLYGRDKVSVVHEKNNNSELIPCAVCGRYLRNLDWGWVCVRSCGFRVSRVIAGKKLPLEQVNKLVTFGSSDIIKGFTSKAGKKFDVRLVIKDKRVVFDFSHPCCCPKCKGSLDVFKLALVCKTRCGFELPRVIYSKELTEKNITDILTKKQTAIIKGFLNKKTTTEFSARVILDDNYKIKLKVKNP